MSDLRIEFRLKNARLYHSIHRSHPTVAAFCRAHGFWQSPVGNLLNLRVSPFHATRRGAYTQLAQKIAEACGELVDYLFPAPLYARFIHKGTHAIEVESPTLPEFEMRRLLGPDPEATVVSTELHEKLSEALAQLPHPLQETIEMYHGLNGKRAHTGNEISQAMGVTRAAVSARLRVATAKLEHYLRRSGVPELLD